LLITLLITAVQIGVGRSNAPANKVLARQMDIELGRAKAEKWEMRLSSGAMYATLGLTGELDRRADEAARAGLSAPREANIFRSSRLRREQMGAPTCSKVRRA